MQPPRIQNGETPLMQAGVCGNFDSAELLLSRKADLNPQHKVTGKTALDYAKERKLTEVCTFLLQVSLYTLIQASIYHPNATITNPLILSPVENRPDPPCLLTGTPTH